MEDRKMVERANKIVNLLKLDELCTALKEFEDEDFNAGWYAAKQELSRPEPEEPTVSQADGSGEVGQGDVVPELYGCGCKGTGCQRGNEEEVEARLRDFLNGCRCTASEGANGEFIIDLCEAHAYLVDDPSDILNA